LLLAGWDGIIIALEQRRGKRIALAEMYGIIAAERPDLSETAWTRRQQADVGH